MYLFTASILDETSDNIDLVSINESTIKLENPSGSSVSGSAAIAAYYCNSYPLTTSSPGLVTAVTAADRNSSMLVTGTYSNYSKRLTTVNYNNLTIYVFYSRSTHNALIGVATIAGYKIRISR